MATLQLPATNLANLANLPPGTKLYLTTNSKNPSGKGKLLLIPQGAILQATNNASQSYTRKINVLNVVVSNCFMLTGLRESSLRDVYRNLKSHFDRMLVGALLKMNNGAKLFYTCECLVCSRSAVRFFDKWRWRNANCEHWLISASHLHILHPQTNATGQL